MTTQSNALIDDTSMAGEEKSDEKYGIKYYQTVAWNLEQIAKEEIYSKGDPCDSKGGLSDINLNLQKMFCMLILFLTNLKSFHNPHNFLLLKLKTNYYLKAYSLQ